MTTWYPLVMGREAMVATEHYLSAAAGARIFAKGGNAIDAAVAATLVEGVVNPHMHTIGGEAPMLIYLANARQVVAINGNMTAPARATIAHYRGLGLKLIPPEGLLAAGVPAAFDALATALREFGTLSLSEIVAPAMALCEDGFPMHPGLAGDGETPQDLSGLIGTASIRFNARKFREKWPTSAALYMPGGLLPHSGDLIRNPALATFFRRLTRQKLPQADARTFEPRSTPDARSFLSRRYRPRDRASGQRPTAACCQSERPREPSTTKIEAPVSADYRGVTVHKCQPWSQGPVFLQQLRLLEGFDLAAMGHNSADYIHYLVEAAKLAFADREQYYADPEFTPVPLEGLLAQRYSDLRRALIDPQHASMDQRPGDPIAMRALLTPAGADARSWGPGTIHVTAADGRGNMIAVTASGRMDSRSSPVIDTLGFPLGSQRMQTFFLERKSANTLRPGKRPRTTRTVAGDRATPAIMALLWHARRRSAGSMDLAILPQPGRFRHERARSDRGAALLDRTLPLDLLSA